MGFSYSTYLFDSDSFYQEVHPMVPALDRGDNQLLYQTAKATMEKRPELWPFLDEFFLGEPFQEGDEQPSQQRLLMMVLSQYLRPIPNFHPNGGWEMLEAALPLIGWSQDEARRLLHGDSLCTLLRPGVPYRLQDYLDRPDQIPWCTLYANWIDGVSINHFAQRLSQSRAAYDAAIKDRRAIFARLDWGIASPETISQVESGWNTEALIGLYEDELRVLATASQARTALAISLVW